MRDGAQLALASARDSPRWADLMAHMWLSEDERLSYIRELRERKAARKLEHKAKRGDSAASAQVEAKKEKEKAALKAAQAKAQAGIDESLPAPLSRLQRPAYQPWVDHRNP